MRVLVAAIVAGVGAIGAACGGGSAGFNNPDSLAAAVHSTVQGELDHSTTGSSTPRLTVTRVGCARNGRSNSFTCAVHLNSGTERSVTAVVPPGGRSFAITSSPF
jgi:hypothetical protein